MAEVGGLVTGLAGELRTCSLVAALVRLAIGLMAGCAGRAGTLLTESVTSAMVLGTGKTLPLQAASAPQAAAAAANTSLDWDLDAASPPAGGLAVTLICAEVRA